MVFNNVTRTQRLQCGLLKNKNMVEVYAVKVDTQLEKNQYDVLMTYVSMGKRERIKRFLRFQDSQRMLIGDILIRYLLSKKLKLRNHTLVFGANEYGKPFLYNYEDICFNISHSDAWVVCCIDAFQLLLDFCDGKYDVSKGWYSNKYLYSFLLPFWFTRIRREFLMYIILQIKTSTNCFFPYEKLYKILDENVATWKIIDSVLIKRNVNNDLIFDHKIKRYFQKLYVQEEKILSEMNEISESVK